MVPQKYLRAEQAKVKKSRMQETSNQNSSKQRILSRLSFDSHSQATDIIELARPDSPKVNIAS